MGQEGWPVTFVTDGVESAIEQANAIAGDKHVVVASTTIVQQCLKAGLLEEIHIDLVPVLLGAGIRLFDHLDSPIELESTKVIESTGVTYLTFRIVKECHTCYGEAADQELTLSGCVDHRLFYDECAKR